MIKEPLFSPGDLILLSGLLVLTACLWVYLSAAPIVVLP